MRFSGLFREQLTSSEKAKLELQGRLKELESKLAKLQKELDNVSVGGTGNPLAKQSDEEVDCDMPPPGHLTV